MSFFKSCGRGIAHSFGRIVVYHFFCLEFNAGIIVTNYIIICMMSYGRIYRIKISIANFGKAIVLNPISASFHTKARDRIRFHSVYCNGIIIICNIKFISRFRFKEHRQRVAVTYNKGITLIKSAISCVIFPPNTVDCILIN